ncbi:hypothetical protein C6A27_01150 [Streptococcus anginosus]|uniref:Uncharacterized protein n=1 Tax=Streptococcus anginosus TaxID=1328 RepID=A0A2T0G9F7_STRAP|nr:hypothetical protein [Streptococcus anginosus]PRT72683.1 hypothetical protein C6A27_01150 [Streptococcus anginosus]
MNYEILLEDLLADLSASGIDISKLKITEEQQFEENILEDFISSSHNMTVKMAHIIENKKAITHYELSYSFLF